MPDNSLVFSYCNELLLVSNSGKINFLQSGRLNEMYYLANTILLVADFPGVSNLTR